MSFKEWFNEDEHDTYNFPEEAMEAAWNAAIAALDHSYGKLLYAVQNKYPGETRHETALRIITQDQQSSGRSGSDIGSGGGV
jgi:hypothetical protein